MQLITNSSEAMRGNKVFENIAVVCNDNGEQRTYEFPNTTASAALHEICAVYSLRDVKILKLKNYTK